MPDGAWRRARLADAPLYLCTDRRADPGRLAAFLAAVLAAGVDLVQLRDKEATPDEVRAAAPVFRALADQHGALFILNDDPALALACGADGVHVGQDDPDPDQARAVVGPDLLIGRSTHSTEEFDRGLEEDCDYLAVGPVHATPTKAGRSGVGLNPVRHAATAGTDRPWFVTGGMSEETAPAVLAAGGTRLVVVRRLTGALDPAAAAARLAHLLRAGDLPD
ncbi:MAG: thiamine phosphate synthase [Nitriliruptorales bacterium]|nr:thiamine phosphate synthase [Nitriliruptorales bacterium]